MRRTGFKLTGALEREDSPWLGQDPALLAGCPASGLAIVADPLPLLIAADAIIDFSSPAASVELAGLAAQARIADVIGTTGLDEADLDKIDAAARHAPIVLSGNMSVGVNLLAALTRRAASVLGPRFRYRNRRDASSHEGRRALRNRALAWRSSG